MEWLNNLVSSWTKKTEEEVAIDVAEKKSTASRKITANMKETAKNFKEIEDDAVKAATADLLESIGIKMPSNTSTTTATTATTSTTP